MTSMLPRALIALLFSAAVLAQDKQSIEAKQLRTAELLADTFDLRRYHGDAAVGFAKLGPAALPVLERELREGTSVEALGALISLVAVPAERDQVIRLVEYVLSERTDVLEHDDRRRQIFGRRSARGTPAGVAIASYLQRHVNSTPKAIDLLWSMVNGRSHAHAVMSLERARRQRSRLMQHLAQGLDSPKEADRDRALEYLHWVPQYRLKAPPNVTSAIEEALALSKKGGNSKQHLAKIRELAKSRDRNTRAAAKRFLTIAKNLDKARRAGIPPRQAPPATKQPARNPAGNDVAKPSARTARDKPSLLERSLGMLDVVSLRKRAIGELAGMGDDAIQPLAKILDADNALVSDGAVQALAKMQTNHEKVAKLLLRVLVDSNRSSAMRITSMVYLSSSLDSNEAVFEGIRDRTSASEPADVRIAAIRALARTEKHRHEVINTLEVLLRDKNAEIVSFTMATLGSLVVGNDDRIVMLLLRQLRSEDKKIKKAAIYALSGKGVNVQLARLREKPNLDPELKKAIDQVLAEKKKVLAGYVIADYSDNRIIQVDLKGNEVRVINEIFGAWDAEILDNGNFLITHFSTNRITEVTPGNRTVWSFTDLKNPYDADRLDNGNTLIADTFGRRVVEVDKAGDIVWSYDKNIHPYDVERLRNGNTLIADTRNSRVIEVSPVGRIVWEVKNLPNVHDVDRLPNGNTLVTIRMLNEVREIDRNGRIVSQIQNLKSPSDADRLPDGRTLVAENGFMRLFDTRGVEVQQKTITWAVEANAVWKHQLDAQRRAAGK